MNGARASMVNRTHRIVRARAAAMNMQQERARSLWLPLAICSALLVTLCYAAWTMLAPIEGALEQPGLASEPGSLMPVLLIWFLPVSIAAGIFVLTRRSRGDERAI